jgi:hypothetical protein
MVNSWIQNSDFARVFRFPLLLTCIRRQYQGKTRKVGNSESAISICLSHGKSDAMLRVV